MSRLRKALERAKEERASHAPDTRTLAAEGADEAPARGEADDGAEELELAYTSTRVESVDPGDLLRSKVLSLLHTGTVPDQIKILRTQLLNRLAELGGNSILVTSANPGEGKTFTSMNLAVSIAHEVNRTVLLVDADIRKPRIHQYFHLGSPPGLSDYLLGFGEIPDLLVNPGIPKLTILPAGNSLANSSELLGSPRMRSLVEEMKARYPDRFLIFDSPSLLSSADALVFSRYIDGVLLVVEAERSSRNEVARTIELLGDRPMLGIVFNKWKDLK